jgi:hypothetical protein
MTNNLNENNTQLNFNLYPVPTSDKLFIEIENKTNVSIEIIDGTGKVLIDELYSQSGIDVNELTQGLYFLKITSDKGSQTVQFNKSY